MVFHCRMLIMPYGTESKSRNADFMFIARKGDTTTLGPKGRQTYEPSGRRPVHLKNLSPCPLSEANITRRRQAAITLGPEAR